MIRRKPSPKVGSALTASNSRERFFRRNSTASTANVDTVSIATVDANNRDNESAAPTGNATQDKRCSWIKWIGDAFKIFLECFAFANELLAFEMGSFRIIPSSDDESGWLYNRLTRMFVVAMALQVYYYYWNKAASSSPHTTDFATPLERGIILFVNGLQVNICVNECNTSGLSLSAVLLTLSILVFL